MSNTEKAELIKALSQAMVDSKSYTKLNSLIYDRLWRIVESIPVIIPNAKTPNP